MKYITGYHSLNQVCVTGTSGDWHPASVNWDKPNWGDTSLTPLADREIYLQPRRYKGEIVGEEYIASHSRAIADLIYEYINTDPKRLRSIFDCVSDWIDIPEQVEVLKDLVTILYKNQPEKFEGYEERKFLVMNFGREFLEELENSGEVER